MDKKKTAILTLKVATGYYALGKASSGLKGSVGRLKSLLSLSGNKQFPCNRGEYKYTVYTPFLYQYGREEAGVFIPEGSGPIEEINNAPKDKIVLKGAFMGDNNFKELLESTFTEEQIKSMVGGFELSMTIFAIGSVVIILSSLLFVLFGMLLGPLLSLSIAIAAASHSIKNAVLADRLIHKSMTGWRESLSTRGLRGFFKL